MTEKRVIIGHARHSAQGPHLDLPAGFVPLRLRLGSENASIEVVCQTAIVGRHTDADLRLVFPDISRRHCRLSFEGGQWRVYDLKSLNGVLVNNVAMIDAPLYAGDMLRVGCVEMLVVAGTPVRMTKADEARNDKLREIVKALPADRGR
jgi:pSer/pThr/pTyr-binding forkhead associated (FHA) protein